MFKKKKQEIKTTKAYERVKLIIDNIYKVSEMTYHSSIGISCVHEIKTNLGTRYCETGREYIKFAKEFTKNCYSGEIWASVRFQLYGIRLFINKNKVHDIKITKPLLNKENKGMTEEEIFLSLLEIENMIKEKIDKENKDKLEHETNEESFKQRLE